MTVTVWRLIDPSGIEARCVLENFGPDAWVLGVERAGELVSSDQYPTADVAFAKANAMWLERMLDGWTEP